MDLAILLVRTLVLYFLLMLTLQLLFRRRKTTLADLLVAFMIAQFAVLAVDRPEKPLLAILLPTLLLLVLHQLFKPVINKKEESQNLKSPPDNRLKAESRIPLRAQTADVEMGALETVAASGPIGPLPLPLILDGRVLDHNLEQLGKTRFWLKNEVQRYGVRRFKEVAYCSMDRYGHMFLDKKKL